jgi:hypothetical protein
MGAYPDQTNPVVCLNEETTHRLSIASAQKAAKEPEEQKNAIVFGHHTRVLIILIANACLMMIIANSLALNFTVICMFDDGKEGVSSNETGKLNFNHLSKLNFFSKASSLQRRSDIMAVQRGCYRNVSRDCADFLYDESLWVSLHVYNLRDYFSGLDASSSVGFISWIWVCAGGSNN